MSKTGILFYFFSLLSFLPSAASSFLATTLNTLWLLHYYTRPYFNTPQILYSLSRMAIYSHVLYTLNSSILHTNTNTFYTNTLLYTPYQLQEHTWNLDFSPLPYLASHIFDNGTVKKEHISICSPKQASLSKAHSDTWANKVLASTRSLIGCKQDS